MKAIVVVKGIGRQPRARAASLLPLHGARACGARRSG